MVVNKILTKFEERSNNSPSYRFADIKQNYIVEVEKLELTSIPEVLQAQAHIMKNGFLMKKSENDYSRDQKISVR